MNTTLPARLGITDGAHLAVLHAPDGIEHTLGELPDGVVLQHGLRKSERVDVILGFVPDREHLGRNIGWLVSTVNPGGAFWVAFPSPSSGAPTDMTEEGIREAAEAVGWVVDGTTAIDDDWSAAKLVVAD